MNKYQRYQMFHGILELIVVAYAWWYFGWQVAGLIFLIDFLLNVKLSLKHYELARVLLKK